MVSEEVTNSQKELALNAIEDEKEIMKLENRLVNLIKEEGFSNVYVEYQKKSIKVVIKTDELTNEQAATIFSIILNNSNSKLLPEIEIIA